ncbi:MAG: cyclic nucleotide-binding domain-containing protein [Desulfonatronovibrio sp.]
MNSSSFHGISRSMVTLENGRELFVQDDKADFFYVVLSGRIGVYRDKQKITELGPDAVVGAEPLFSPGSSYFYTVRASGMVRVSRYAYSDLLDMLGAQPGIFSQILNSLCAQLKDFWFRTGSDMGAAPDLHFLGEIRSYAPDEMVIREGEFDTEIFRIVSSEKGLEVAREGHRLTILETPGDFFGEMAAVLDEKRTASVRSLGNSILEVYPGDQLQNILTDYPQVSMRIITALSKRLAETTKELTEIRSGKSGKA